MSLTWPSSRALPLLFKDSSDGRSLLSTSIVRLLLFKMFCAMDVRRLLKDECLVKSINDALPVESMIEPLHMLSATVLSVFIDWPKMLLLALSGTPLEVSEKIEPP